jgi:hypothetical protein
MMILYSSEWTIYTITLCQHNPDRVICPLPVPALARTLTKRQGPESNKAIRVIFDPLQFLH